MMVKPPVCFKPEALNNNTGVWLGMEQYGGLARVYDYLVSGVDYEAWIDYLEALMREFNLAARSAADLACGTGNTAIPLAKRGYQVTGIDIAPEMLHYARQKAAAQNLDMVFSQQDMRCFSLPEPVDLITCFHDGLNYLLHIDAIKQTFSSVHKNLREKGAFIFDLNAVTWTAGDDGDITVIDEADLTLIYETNYSEDNQVWQIKLTGFIREQGHYHKFTEMHREKAYRPDEIVSLLAETGFDCLGSFNAFSFNPISPQSIRHFYVAQKR